MEILAFIAVAFVVILYLVWRSRRGTSSGPDAFDGGRPNDLRDKNEGFR